MLRSKFDSHNFLLALESFNLLYVCKLLKHVAVVQQNPSGSNQF